MAAHLVGLGVQALHDCNVIWCAQAVCRGAFLPFNDDSAEIEWCQVDGDGRRRARSSSVASTSTRLSVSSPALSVLRGGGVIHPAKRRQPVCGPCN